MSPIEHFGIVFLPAAAIVVVLDRRLPTREFVGAAFVGSVFPDIVDKPLAHEVGLLPSGRVFMHSIPPALPVWLAVAWYGWRTHRSRLSAVFVAGHLLHILADHYQSFRGPNRSLPPEVLWPITGVAPRPPIPGWAGPQHISLHLWTLFSVSMLVVLAYVVIEDVVAHTKCG